VFLSLSNVEKGRGDVRLGITVLTFAQSISEEETKAIEADLDQLQRYVLYLEIKCQSLNCSTQTKLHR
jgi:hypothetical protein